MSSLIYYLHILIVTVSFSYVPPAFATVTQILCKTNIRKSRKKCLNCFSRIPSFWIRNIPILNSLPWLTPHLTRFRTVLFCNRCFRSLSFGLIICGIRPKKNTGYPKFNIRCIPRKDLRSVPISNAKNTTEARFLYASNRTISFIPFRLLSLPHC